MSGRSLSRFATPPWRLPAAAAALLATAAGPAWAQLPPIALEPLAPFTLERAHLALLPATHHLGSVVDRTLVGGVSGQPSLGALARFEPLRLGVHGHGATQWRFTLDGLDISDPARPGEPLLDLTPALVERLSVRSLWSDTPLVELTLPTAAGGQGASVSGRWGLPAGGDTWVPRGLMDREPALAAGATPVRRALGDGRELTAEVAAGLPRGQLWLGGDLADYDQRYPTLVGADGVLVPDRARQVTGLGSWRWQLRDVPLHLTFAWQGTDQTHAGAAARLPPELTTASGSDAVLVHAGTQIQVTPALRLLLAAGVAWRHDRSVAASAAPWSFDLEGQWSWLARPRFPEDVERQRYDAAAVLELGADRLTVVSLRAAHAQLAVRPTVPGGLVTQTLGPAAAGVTFLAGQQELEATSSARLSCERRLRLGALEGRLHLALDAAAVSVPEGQRWGSVDPAGGLALALPLGGSLATLALRREPLALGRQVAAFLDPRRLNGVERAWLDDDGDLLFEPGEVGPLRRRTGGDAHRAAARLRRPSGHELVAAWRSPAFGLASAPLQVLVRGVGRLTTDPWTVRLAGEAARGWAPRLIEEPGGKDGVARPLVVYERLPGSAGRELYVLTNAPDPDLYLGAEVWLANAAPGWWLFALGLTGYLSRGAATFGLHADRNDPGILDEAAADPNARINARGRADHDRAFGANLLVGLQPGGWLDGASAALVVRYRDGEPMTRLWTADLPQGPTVVMTVPRGEPSPRFTFQMTVDLRLAYALRLRGLEVQAALEVENLLGSGTELAETPVTGPSFRRALEMVPGRSLWLEVQVAWPR